MGIKKHQPIEKEEFVFPTLTELELKKLDETLEKFRINKTLSDGKEVSYIDIDAWLLSENAINEHGAIRIPASEQIRSLDGELIGTTNPPKYVLLWHQYRQHSEWKAKREFAKKHQLQHLQDSLQGQMIHE